MIVQKLSFAEHKGLATQLPSGPSVPETSAKESVKWENTIKNGSIFVMKELDLSLVIPASVRMTKKDSFS